MSGVIRVTVIGGGLAGKAFTNMLINRIQQSSLKATSLEIHLLQGRGSFEGSASASEHHLYTGIWTKGAQILQQIVQPDVSPEAFLSAHGCSVGESGYRAADGQRIMKPRRGMQPYPNKPSLTFIRNDDLVALLDSSLQRQQKSVSTSAISVSFTNHQATQVNRIDYLGQTLTVFDERGRAFPTDILIAADGAHSRVRHQLLPQLTSSSSSSTNDAYHPLSYRGYRVYRGVLDRRHGPEHAQLIDELQRQAFQTWAPNRRFAVVPTAHGIAWFAALARSQTNTAPAAHAGATRSVQDDPEAYALLVDRFCGLDATTALHDPIAKIIQATDRDLIRYNDAYASPAVHSTLLGIHCLRTWKKTLCHSHETSRSYAYDSDDVTTIQALPTTTQERLPQPVLCAFLGDAAHTLDPILAQGAGIALEDADHVAQVIAHHIRQQDQARQQGPPKADSASSQSSTASATVPPTLQQISDTLAAQRRRRLQRLHSLSVLAQYLGQHPSPVFHSLRNTALLTVQGVLPASLAAGIVGRSFDAMIRRADRSETFSIASVPPS